ncbi:hypothetical protein R69746_08212 [Paraburkholderia aspalathi]|nr:hypothetical protein R69746_08212 [Paraburkholderia aspalathi]
MSESLTRHWHQRRAARPPLPMPHIRRNPVCYIRKLRLVYLKANGNRICEERGRLLATSAALASLQQ